MTISYGFLYLSLLDFFGCLAETERLRYCKQFFLNVAECITLMRYLNSQTLRTAIYNNQG